MKTKNIKTGMIIKNYKELCELLGIEVRNGSNSKKKQLKEFSKYFEWENNKHSFVITKVYSKPRVFTEDEMIELLLLHLLATNENDDKYTIISTKRKIYEKLKMVNLNYQYCLNNPREVAAYKNIPEKVALDTTTSLDSALGNKLTNTLKSLSDRKIIFHYDVFIISYNLSTREPSNFETFGCSKVATDEESELCVGIEGDILRELKCASYTEMKIQGKEKLYNKRVKEELQKHGINSFYRAIKIIFIERRVPELVNKFIRKFKLSDKNYLKYIEKVNEEIQIQTRNNANKRFENAKVEIKEVLREIERLNEKINNNNHKHSGFLKLSTEEKQLREKMIEERDAYEQELRRYEHRLELLETRSDENYPLYVEELIELMIDLSTDKTIDDIKLIINTQIKKYN